MPYTTLDGRAVLRRGARPRCISLTGTLPWAQCTAHRFTALKPHPLLAGLLGRAAHPPSLYQAIPETALKECREGSPILHLPLS